MKFVWHTENLCGSTGNIMRAYKYNPDFILCNHFLFLAEPLWILFLKMLIFFCAYFVWCSNTSAPKLWKEYYEEKKNFFFFLNKLQAKIYLHTEFLRRSHIEK